MRSSMICASLLALSCAASRVQPASQPSSMRTDVFEMVDRGMPAPEDGFFLSVQGARDFLKASRIHELDLQEQLAESQLQQQQDEKTIAKDEFLSRWGLPLGGIAGLLIGGILGVVAAHR